MAQKQPESNPNNSSSSEEEEEDEEEEEATGSEDSQSESDSDSDSGENKQTPDKKTLISQNPSKPTNNLQNPDQNLSESEEESGSDTDSDDSPAKEAGTGTGKVVPAKPISVKRPAPAPAPEKVTVPEVKKAKKDGSGDDDCKKQLFQRLWSEDDEIVILKGMIDYKKENGESPVNDMGAFHEFIKKSLHVDVSRAQLVDKIRRLKKKYVNNLGKEKNGKDRSFSKSHEQKGYDLSKLIWGSGSGTESKTTESKKKAKNGGSVVKGNVASGISSVVKLNGGVDGKGVAVVKVENGMDVNRFVRYGSNEGPVLVEEVVKGGMELVEGSKRDEMEERWKELKRQELLLCVKRMDLFKEQALTVIDAVNSSEN